MPISHHNQSLPNLEADKPHFSYVTETEPESDTQNEISTFLSEHWGKPKIVSKGKVTDASTIPRIIARDENGALVGLATYQPTDDGSCELVTMDATVQRVGLGSELLKRVEEAARQAHCDNVWLITTNNNDGAKRFYEDNGYSLVAIYENALERSRELKPEIPLYDENGVAIKDEWEYQKDLIAAGS